MIHFHLFSFYHTLPYVVLQGYIYLYLFHSYCYFLFNLLTNDKILIKISDNNGINFLVFDMHFNKKDFQIIMLPK